MQSTKLKFFLLFVLLLINVQVWAQLGDGSLGDPVFTFDFGSGNTPKHPTTTYTYVTGSCPDDGQYALSKTETGCHDTWHTVLKDHTGNDGYMMVVNADNVAGKEFFSTSTGANSLCGNTIYEFSAYVLNLIKAGQSGFKRPKIEFTIQTTGGVQLAGQTIEIPETYDANGWVKYGIYFTTPAGETEVVIKMVNKADGGNGNDLLLDDIVFRAWSPLIKAGIAGNLSYTEQNVCVGGPNIPYTITTTPPTGYNNAKFQWQLNIGNGWNDMTTPGSTSGSVVVTPPANIAGVYQYRLGVAEGNNINSLNCRVYSNSITIKVNSYPVVPDIGDKEVCEGDGIVITASGGVSYKWTPPNQPSSTQNPLVINNASAIHAGLYRLDVTSADNCTVTKYFNVIIKNKPNAQVGDANPSICRGSSVTLSASGGVSYSWLPTTGLANPNSANPVASPNNTTVYTVTVTGSNGCSSTAQVTVDVKDVPTADAGSDKKIFEGQSVKLDGSATGDNITYTWFPADYLDNPLSLTPVATPPNDITYTLTVTSANNCGPTEKSVFIRVYKKIIIPNTFSPNNDGVNDLWNIEALMTYPQSTTTVYTGNGKQVFQSKGYSKPWDGKYNGNILPTGTYYYVIDLKNGTPSLSGWVMLVK